MPISPTRSGTVVPVATLAAAVMPSLPLSASAAEVEVRAEPDANHMASAVAGGIAATFPPIVATGTGTERALADESNTVYVITGERMGAQRVRNLKNRFRYAPLITVTEGFGRFGIGDLRICGFGGNRARIETDGITVPNALSIGGLSSVNRNFVDLGTLTRVEVVRGPTSALYGFDGPGGIVAFVTQDPSDCLQQGTDACLGFRVGFDGERGVLFAGVTSAFGGKRWSRLLVVAHRQGQERDNEGAVGGEGAARSWPNRQHGDGRSVLARLAFAPDVTRTVH